MRTRLRYLLLAPSTPARIAGWTTDLLALLVAAVVMVGILAGYSPVVALGHLIVATGDLLGVQA